jgi:hypothetical protein
MHAFSVDEVDLDEVADWAVRTGRYQRPPLSVVQQCKRELARTCREEYHTDPQKREVRSLHPIRIKEADKQMVIWADIRTARPNHMRISLQQRRRGIAADVRQHWTDWGAYNDNNVHGATLPLFDYNFNPDLEESQFSGEWPEDKPE